MTDAIGTSTASPPRSFTLTHAPSRRILSEVHQYRPDIDGMRCIAVMLVILYHAFPSLVTGGFIGVDIFFVISGFLITSQLVQSSVGVRESGWTVMRDFYMRRVRRIFPALAIVLLATYGIGLILLTPDDLVALAKTMAGGALFSSNIVLLQQTGYFDVEAARKPLLHLWSLGVEEQFYIFWPLLILASRKWDRRHVVFTTISLIALSFSLHIALVRFHHGAAAFYLPLTRCWELAAGALLSLGFPTGHKRTDTSALPRVFSSFRSALPELLALLAFAGIIYAALWMPRKIAYPAWSTLLPVIGAMILIRTPRSKLNRLILSSRLMVTIGLISYPLYLWHYPLLAYLRIWRGGELNLSDIGIAITASTALSFLVYYGVERPIRHGTRAIPQVKAFVLCGIVGVIAMAGSLTVYRQGFPARFPPVLQISADRLNVQAISAWREHECFLEPEDDISLFSSRCAGAGRHPLVLLWGDSSAASIFPGLQTIAAKRRYDVAQYTASACPPLLGVDQPDRPKCRATNDFVINRIATLKPELVILQSYWRYGPIDEALSRTIEELRRIGIKRIVLIGPDIIWQGGLPQTAYRYYFDHKNTPNPYLPERIRADMAVDLDDGMRLLAQKLHIRYISAIDTLCNESGCLTSVDGKLIAFDFHHLTIAGADYFAQAIGDKIFGSD
ncbi:MAG TPA: acyltransferase family protein [Dongiaceae bacterium]|nr:acyltransferase family protein [Dongiaceae bacterium]